MDYYIVFKKDKESNNWNNESLLIDGKLRDELERGVDYDIITRTQWELIKHKYNREIKCDDFYTVEFDFLCKSRFCEYCKKAKNLNRKDGNLSTNSICDYLNYEHCNIIPVTISNNESTEKEREVEEELVEEKILNNSKTTGKKNSKEISNLLKETESCNKNIEEKVTQNYRKIKVFGVENIFNAIKDLFINPMISIEDFKNTFIIKCNGNEIENPEEKFNSYKEKELKFTVELREIKNNPLITSNNLKTSSCRKEEENLEKEKKQKYFYMGDVNVNSKQQIYSKRQITIDRTSKCTLFPVEDVAKKNLNFEYLNGLDNLGNTCYMNSSLQCLFNCKKLSEALVKTEVTFDDSEESLKSCSEDSDENLKEVDSLSMKNKYKNFLNAYKKSIIRLGFGGYANPRLIKQEFERINSLFLGSEQQDAQEFIIGALDAIHEATVIGSDLADINVSTESIISKLFYGEFEIIRKCKSCGFKAIKTDVFSTLSLPIPTDTITVHLNYGKFQSVQIQNRTKISELYKYIPKTLKLLLITEYSGYHMSNVISPYNNCIEKNETDNNSDSDSGYDSQTYNEDLSYKNNFLIPENNFNNLFLERNSFNLGNKKSFVVFEYSKGEIHLLLRTFYTKFYFIASKLQLDILININDLVYPISPKYASLDLKSDPVNNRVSLIEKIVRDNQTVIFERVFLKLRKKFQDDIVFEQFKNNVVLNNHISKDFSKSNLTSQLFNRNIFCIDLKIFNYDYIFSSASIFNNKLHLRDCINNFKQVEEIEYNCSAEGCNGKKSEIYYRFSKYPKYLIIILKRFTYTGSKITDYVHFHEKIVLDGDNHDLFYNDRMDKYSQLKENVNDETKDDTFLKDEKKSFNGRKYTLFGVICHMEIGIWSGHYVAYVKKRNSWYCCNDKNIMKGKIDKKNAYVLFYELDES